MILGECKLGLECLLLSDLLNIPAGKPHSKHFSHSSAIENLLINRHSNLNPADVSHRSSSVAYAYIFCVSPTMKRNRASKSREV
jgi:hypothetical protein